MLSASDRPGTCSCSSTIEVNGEVVHCELVNGPDHNPQNGFAHKGTVHKDHRFVDKLELLDGNGSDCTINLMKSVEEALNLIGKCTLIPEGEEIA